MTAEETTALAETNTPTNKLLDSWSTSYGLVVLGWFCSSALGFLASGISNTTELSLSSWILLLILGIGFTVIALIYALVIYPSFFTNKPRLISSNAVSFCNGFIGGIIFGFIWCSNLNKRYKGISNGIFVALTLITLIGSLAIGYFEGINETNAQSSLATVQSTQSAAQIKQDYIGSWSMLAIYMDPDGNDVISPSDAGRSDKIAIKSNGAVTYSMTENGKTSTSSLHLVRKNDSVGGYYLVNDNTRNPEGYAITDYDNTTKQTYLYIFLCTEEGEFMGQGWMFGK